MISFNLLSKENGCVVKEAVAYKKIVIDIPLFWDHSTIRYVVWCPD